MSCSNDFCTFVFIGYDVPIYCDLRIEIKCLQFLGFLVFDLVVRIISVYLILQTLNCVQCLVATGLMIFFVFFSMPNSARRRIGGPTTGQLSVKAR